MCKSGTVFAGSSGKGVSGRAIRGCTGLGLERGERWVFLEGNYKTEEGGDAGIAIGAGTDCGGREADIVLVRSDPQDDDQRYRLLEKDLCKNVPEFSLGDRYDIVRDPV